MADSRIEDLARRLLDSLPPAVRGFGKDVESNFRAALRANLSKLDLVARDEFDAQSRLLERTRAQLAELEGRLQALESSSPPSDRESATTQREPPPHSDP